MRGTARVASDLFDAGGDFAAGKFPDLSYLPRLGPERRSDSLAAARPILDTPPLGVALRRPPVRATFAATPIRDLSFNRRGS